jgi:2-polyprenyl-3-methyl-5-hydroxy-6-metoxy-1,4-benzoquinol methylase
MKLSKEFFKRRIERYTPYQIVIAEAIYKAINPKSVFDVGCGIGGYLQGFNSLGCKIAGCELGYDIAKEFMSDCVKLNAFGHDATKQIHHKQKYNLVLSIEVAEHLNANGAEQFCKNLINLSWDKILLTAAGIGQKGKHHVNCQPKQYWIDMMKKHSADYSEAYTKKVIDSIKKINDPLGITKNMMVFTV